MIVRAKDESLDVLVEVIVLVVVGTRVRVIMVVSTFVVVRKAFMVIVAVVAYVTHT